MTGEQETAELVALLRLGRRSWVECARLVEQSGSVFAALDRALGEEGAQTMLFSPDARTLVHSAQAALREWRAKDIRVSTMLSPGYPRNLAEVHDRPPLLFVSGDLQSRDDRSIAVIGARRASPEGLALADAFAGQFVDAGYTVISGLATGIDTAAHESALRRGGRTVAVIGTGLSQCYPPQNARLQERIAYSGAVVSQFWPDDTATRASFPMRNAVMSGLSRGSVVIEASERSGARTQARLALGHGRPVFLLRRLLGQPWGRELAAKPGVQVVSSADEVIARIASDLHQPFGSARTDRREPQPGRPTSTGRP